MKPSETTVPAADSGDSTETSLKKAIQEKADMLEAILKQKFRTPKGWKFQQADLSIGPEGETIDLVFAHPDPKDRRYVLMDISVPHLQIGQKFTLPDKAKAFQKQEVLTIARVKKAILLVRKGNETISTAGSRLKCPILEVQMSSFLPGRTPEQPKPHAPPVPIPSIPVKDVQSAPPASQQPSLPGPVAPPTESTAKVATPQSVIKDSPTVNKEPSGRETVGRETMSNSLLQALREAVVHECLGTLHKRRNKYVRKGLWRWIEREILDPNVHFFLIVLSSIYQGKVGDVLSRKCQNLTAYLTTPDTVIEAVFCNESSLAPEIIKAGERHKRALGKFLACFAQTPPFEYLRSLFLKEFRASRDGLKARISVFDTLAQLLQRCGFQGEKEVQYPLEILDELGVFQGILTGNYTQLRVENAAKKLKHLVPTIDWSSAEIYRLRDDIAKLLQLPPQEFNLNAFLPQAFVQTAQQIAAGKREAMAKAPNQPRLPLAAAADEKPERQAVALSGGRGSHRFRDDRNRQSRPDAPTSGQTASHQAPVPSQPHGGQSRQAQEGRNGSDSRRHSDLRSDNRSDQRPDQRHDQRPESRPNQDRPRHDPSSGRVLLPSHPSGESDGEEARQRYFDQFGGHVGEDLEAVRFALDMDRAVAVAEQDFRDNMGKEEVFPEDGPPPLKGRPQPPVRLALSSDGEVIPPRRPRRNRKPGQHNKSRQKSGKNRGLRPNQRPVTPP